MVSEIWGSGVGLVKFRRLPREFSASKGRSPALFSPIPPIPSFKGRPPPYFPIFGEIPL